ncbi:MAG TPA: glycosyltransferase family 4 protein [Thermoanaerobaculia bacterium]|nr:glycosyltransferase family 4 protein [Thermoanaerobaculia bacterium]
MRILFCSQAAYTGGGVETWLESLSAALAARGWDVVTGLAKGRFHDPERYAERHRVLAPVAIDGTRGFLEDRIRELVRLFERVRPDVIFPVNLNDALLAAAYWKTRGADARLAMCIHGQGEDRIGQARAFAPFLDLTASVSRRVADLAHARHIPTGVPLPLRDTPPRERLQRIAYIGRFDSDKRIRDLVPLVRALPELTFELAGNGPDEPYLRDALAGANVTFHGQLSRDALYESIYPNIDAIVVFSGAETGPIVAWEAMLHGVVPVVSDYLGRREENVIRHGETGLVFPVGDVDEAARLIRAQTSPHELSQRARALPPAYTEAAFGDAWDAALRTAVQMPARRGTAHDLPPLVSAGILARLGLARLRRLLGRSFVHGDSGSEWPH